MFWRKSAAPRTSPYSVAPQFDHRLKNAIIGMSRNVAPIANPPTAGDAKPPAVPAFSVAAYASSTPYRSLDWSLKCVMKLALELKSSSRTITARPMRPP